MAAIIDSNGFRAMAALRTAATDPRIEEIEGAGMDEGRVFLWLVPGFNFEGEECHIRSVGSARELKEAMRSIRSCDCDRCYRTAAKAEGAK